MADDLKCPYAECSAKTFKTRQARDGHLRWKVHAGAEGLSKPAAFDVPRTTGSLPREPRESTSHETRPNATGETRQSTPPPVRESPLDRERRRLAGIMARPVAESSIFDGPDKLVAGIASKLVGPVTERFESAILMIDRIKKLPRPPLPRLPRPPWPF